MTDEESPTDTRLKLYITPEHPCSYLDNHRAKTLFVDPEIRKSPWLYQALIDMGFRRSGDMIYRPECDDCRACVPVRIPVSRFSPNRSQRRTWKKCRSKLEVNIKSSAAIDHYYDLFETYIKQRHPDGDMADTTPEKYIDFLTCHWNETSFIEFTLDTQTVAVAVTDRLPEGLSAVYTFFDPAYSNLSLGVFALLWQIEWAKQLNLPWLYLGYWIPDCKKMAYKTDYTPIQAYTDGHWMDFEISDEMSLKSLSKQIRTR